MASLVVAFEVGTRRDEIVEDFCLYHGRPATVRDAQGADVPNPVTRGEYMKAKIKDFIIESIKAHRVTKEAEVARKAAITKTNTEIVMD